MARRTSKCIGDIVKITDSYIGRYACYLTEDALNEFFVRAIEKRSGRVLLYVDHPSGDSTCGYAGIYGNHCKIVKRVEDIKADK